MVAGPGATIAARSAGPDATERLGADLAAVVPVATVIGLVGPLGAGKTCFVRGLAAGLGVDPDDVASPTFVYLVDYPARGGRRLYHADLYRFADLTLAQRERALASIGLEEALHENAVTAVEWWEYHVGALPVRWVRVEFTMETADDRLLFFHFEGPEMAAAAQAMRARLVARNVRVDD